jgi:hypothetical protein
VEFLGHVCEIGRRARGRQVRSVIDRRGRCGYGCLP